MQESNIPTLGELIGKTPMVRLQRLSPNPNITICLKLEGNNPAGSVKDRPAYNMIKNAESLGHIQAGDTLIEATSGNTGIALAMVSALLGYKMILIMPEHQSEERKKLMRLYGAELIEVTKQQGMEGARDLATQMEHDKQGKVLNQFANKHNPQIHYLTTGPEIWQATKGQITHFISAMGTTGTISGCGKYFNEQNSNIEIIGCQPAEGSDIPGIRKWPPEYTPAILAEKYISRYIEINETNAINCAHLAARKEGLAIGPSSGGALWAAIETAKQIDSGLIVAIACDRADRYLSTKHY